MWRNVPESRHEIEQAVVEQKPEPYVYAFQEPNSCSQRHCLSVNANVVSPLDDGHGGHITAHIHSD